MKLYIFNFREQDEKPYFERFGREYNIAYEYTTEYPTLANIELLRGRGYEAVSTIVSDMSAPVLEKFAEVGVRCISTRSVGYDHFDMQRARQLGLTICVTPYPPHSVANYAIMLMMMCLRRMKHILQMTAVQDYSFQGKLGKDISSCTIGIIGTGKVGSTVARHLSGFGSRLLAFDLYPNDQLRKLVTYTDLATIYREADLITLHAPATPENYHFINEQSLGAMKEGVVLINTARGDLIDSEALIRAVESGKVGACALDVLENETGLFFNDFAGQVVKRQELALLKSFPNVIITPHTAFYTAESSASMVENSLKGCLLAHCGQENPFAVT